MIAGELFVELGLVGADKLTKGLEMANSTLGKLAQSSLEATRNLKDMAMQWEGQTTSFSNLGASLKVFDESFGMGALALQQFQQGLLGVNVSADETKANLIQIERVMTDIRRGKAVPESMRLALAMVGTNFSQLKDTKDFVQKLPQLMKQLERDPSLRTALMSDIGLSSRFAQGMGRFTGDFSKIIPAMSKGAFSASAATNALIEKRKYDLEVKIAKLLSGPNVDKALNKIYDILVKFVDLFALLGTLADKSGALELVQMIFDGLKLVVDGLISTVDSVKKEGLLKTLMKGLGGLSEAASGLGIYGNEAIKAAGKSAWNAFPQPSNKPNYMDIVNNRLKESQTPSSVVNNNNFEISSTDPKAAAREVHRILQDKNTGAMINAKQGQTK
jgi:hypothetical protein